VSWRVLEAWSLGRGLEAGKLGGYPCELGYQYFYHSYLGVGQMHQILYEFEVFCMGEKR
jgi:hypothetical protein